MLISRNITIKSRVTQALRAQLGAQAQKTIKELDRQIAQVEELLQREGASGDYLPGLKKEKHEILERKQEMLGNLRDIARLKDGQEIISGQVQGFCNLRVGDLWPGVLDCEIVVEDGRVLAIREGSNVTVSVGSQTGYGQGNDKGPLEPGEG
ncbi:MAG TPA: hypothetical protein GX529_04990 [Firmicutes bacterium]|nr:hypothetical protein [Candidatus Fermentithermobacillaceae bacterium]